MTKYPVSVKGTLLCLAKVLWSNIFISGLAFCLFLMLYEHTHEGTCVHAHVLCTFTHHSFQWFDNFPLTGNNRNIAMPQQKAGKKILVSEYSRQRCFVQENPAEHLNCKQLTLVSSFWVAVQIFSVPKWSKS